MREEEENYSITVHPHGEHQCYCPSCSYVETVEAGVRCGTLVCPQCGDRLRAVETGEYRGIAENPLETGAKHVVFSILAGIGIAIGFYIVSKGLKKA